MTVAAVAASIVFDTAAPMFAWFVATLAFEFWWASRKAAGASSDSAKREDPPPEPIVVVAQPWLATRGVAFLWSVSTAALFTAFAHVKADISLLGIPYWIPLGAMIIGNIGPRGLWLGYHFFGGRRSPRLRSALAYAVLTMFFLYLGQYLTSPLDYENFMRAYLLPHTAWFPRTDFDGPAPLPAFTLLVQLVGYLIGAALLTLPISRR